MTKVKYTEEHVIFILENYIKNEALCVKKTGHSSGSIKLLLQNIGATYGFLNFSEGIEVIRMIKKNQLVNPESSTYKSFISLAS